MEFLEATPCCYGCIRGTLGHLVCLAMCKVCTASRVTWVILAANEPYLIINIHRHSEIDEWKINERTAVLSRS